MLKKFSILLVVTSLAGLTGCANHIPLSVESSQSVKTVYVNPTIKKPAVMYEMASGSEFGFALGPIGGLASGIANEHAAKSTQEIVEQNGIDVSEIVYRQMKNQLAAQRKFHVATAQTGDAVLWTEVLMYGLSIPHGFSTDYVPVLSVKASLMRGDKVIWEDKESVMPLTDGMPRYKMDELKSDPKKIALMWDKASERVVGEMLRDMERA